MTHCGLGLELGRATTPGRRFLSWSALQVLYVLYVPVSNPLCVFLQYDDKSASVATSNAV
jgi:hypothetical protein